MSHQFTAPELFRDELGAALLEHAATLACSDPSPAAGPEAVRRAAGPRVIGRPLVPALALAALVAAAVLSLRAGGAVAPQPATAAGVLRASAAALDRLGGSRALGPDDYFYTRTEQSWMLAGYGAHPYVVRSIQQEWLARDGHGRSRYEVVALSGAGVNRSLPLTRSQDARLVRSPRPFILSTLPSPGILLSYAQLRRLPADPNRLGAALNRIVALARVDRLFPQRAYRVVIGFAILRGLAEAPTSAALRAALYRVLAATPGIRLLGRTRDSIGRYGMAVAIDAQDVQLEMILDPSTGGLLQASRTLLHRSRLFLDGRQPPGLINRATFLASGIVTSTRARIP
jgi:hypothetical protein